ncbi:MAG: MTH938/NDUFAF3 family protein [Hyphomicrobiales bacterium]|nr:MTH938/NDUFAF3 family protein [Hyphomicrobiales bacterium]
MAAGTGPDAKHLPIPAPIEAYGNGGFRFGGMSHRGSLLCFPDGIWAWSVISVTELSEASLASVFAHTGAIDVFLIGAGSDPWVLPAHLRALFRERGISVDVMTTGAAVRTYNILLAEQRRAGVGLIAVD